ncbi:MAG TPA: hypothetical protein VMT00_16565 [Thermoanaerobaculia bacterium]|nr:hypothetical protein [Thermoanaerobaculia bacterium]
MNRLLSHSLAILLVVLSVAPPAAGSQAFYEALYRRGIGSYHVGNFAAAAEELRIAAFGLLERIPQLETAQIYLALVHDRLGRKEQTEKAIQHLLEAERVEARYATLEIPPEIRTAFETLLRTSAPHAERVLVRRVSPREADFPIDEAESRPTAVETPDSIPLRAATAEARLREGKDREAGAIARSVLATEPDNVTAHLVLARIEAKRKKWRPAVSHFEQARASRELEEQDLATLFVAHVSLREYEKASPIRELLAEESLGSNDVRRAGRTLDAALAKKASRSRSASQPAARESVTAATSEVAANGPPTARPPAHNESSQPSPARADNTASASGGAAPRSSIDSTRMSNQTQTLDLLNAAQRAIGEGRLPEARALLLRALSGKDLERPTLLEIGKGLTQSRSWAEASAAYERAGRLRRGEEIHLFYKAIILYEAGDYARAKEYLKLALPELPPTMEMAEYRSKIEAAR